MKKQKQNNEQSNCLRCGWGGKRKYKLLKNAIIAVASKAWVQMNSNSYTSNTKRARLGNPLRLTSVDYFDWF